MRLNRSELKKILYDFNSMSNQLMQADFEDYNIVLRKFLNFLENCDVIKDYLEDCGDATFEVSKEVEEVEKSHGHYIFTVGDNLAEENANVFSILRYIVNNNMPVQYLARGYNVSANKYDDIIKSFNHRFVMLLIRNIERYLTKVGIDMGIDDKLTYSITVNNGQVNLATDSATINATMYNGVDLSELKDLIAKVLTTANDELGEEDKITIVNPRRTQRTQGAEKCEK